MENFRARIDILAAISISGLAVLLLATPVTAQGSLPTTKPGDPVQTPPEKIEPKPVPSSPVPEAPPGSLSDKLGREKGIIPPPKSIDPDMHKMPPEQGKLRVIPPPADGNAAPSETRPN